MNEQPDTTQTPTISIELPVSDLLGHYADPDVVLDAFRQFKEARDRVAEVCDAEQKPDVEAARAAWRELSAVACEICGVDVACAGELPGLLKAKFAELVAELDGKTNASPGPRRGLCCDADEFDCAGCAERGQCMNAWACKMRGDDHGEENCNDLPCEDCGYLKTCPAWPAWEEREKSK